MADFARNPAEHAKPRKPSRLGWYLLGMVLAAVGGVVYWQLAQPPPESPVAEIPAPPPSPAPAPRQSGPTAARVAPQSDPAAAPDRGTDPAASGDSAPLACPSARRAP